MLFRRANGDARRYIASADSPLVQMVLGVFIVVAFFGLVIWLFASR